MYPITLTRKQSALAAGVIDGIATDSPAELAALGYAGQYPQLQENTLLIPESLPVTQDLIDRFSRLGHAHRPTQYDPCSASKVAQIQAVIRKITVFRTALACKIFLS